jgi:hypothetical protein
MVLFTEQPQEVGEAPVHSSMAFGVTSSHGSQAAYTSKPALPSRGSKPEGQRSLWSRMFER